MLNPTQARMLANGLRRADAGAESNTVIELKSGHHAA